MIYMRGQARDYDGWGAGDGFGANPGWSWAECLPYFLKHEDFYKGADEFHAAPGFDPTGKRAGGEWRVEKQRLHWPILDAFLAAAAGPASRAATTSTAATTKASATSTSTSAPASAGTRPRRSCGRRCGVRTWSCGPARTSAASSSTAPGAIGVEIAPLGGGEPVTARLAPGGEIVWPPARSARPDPAALGHRPCRRCSPSTASPCARGTTGVGANLQDHLQIRAVYGVEGARRSTRWRRRSGARRRSACTTPGSGAAR